MLWTRRLRRREKLVFSANERRQRASPVSTKCEDEKEEGRKRNMTRSISEVTAEKRRGRLDRSATQRHETFFPFQNRVSPEMHNKLDKLSMEKSQSSNESLYPWNSVSETRGLNHSTLRRVLDLPWIAGKCSTSVLD